MSSVNNFMPNPPLQFEEVSPEVIGTVQNGRIELDPNAVEAPETPKLPLEEEPPMDEEVEALKDSIIPKVQELLTTLNAIKVGENKVVGSLKKKMFERDETEKADKETRKATEKE